MQMKFSDAAIKTLKSLEYQSQGSHIQRLASQKQASTAYSRRIMTMSDDALRRLAPGAAADRLSGKVPIYLTGENSSMFGYHVPKGGAGVVPSLLQHLVREVRNHIRGLPGDRLAKRTPGHFQRWAEGSKYW